MNDQNDKKTNLPATPDQEADNIYKAANARVPILKFRKGKYFIGDDEVPLGRKFLAYAGDWRRGWRKWKDDQVVEDRIVRVADNRREPAERDELDDQDKDLWEKGLDGKPKDPWSPENQLPVEDIETGERLLFVTTSLGGKIAVEKLCGRYAANIKKGLEKGLPIIELATTDMPTKAFGLVPRPDLVIVGWENDDGGGPIDVTPPNKMNDEIPF